MSGNPYGKHVIQTGHQRPTPQTTPVTPSDERTRTGGGGNWGKKPIEQTPLRERIGGK